MQEQRQFLQDNRSPSILQHGRRGPSTSLQVLSNVEVYFLTLGTEGVIGTGSLGTLLGPPNLKLGVIYCAGDVLHMLFNAYMLLTLLTYVHAGCY